MSQDTPNRSPFEFGTEIRFQLRDSSYPIVNISERLDCRVDVLETINADPEESRLIEFYHVESENRDRILTAASACNRTVESRVILARNDVTLLELQVVDCIAATLSDEEAIVLDAQAEDGECEVTAFLPPDRDPSVTVDTVTERHPPVDVAALNKRPIAAPFLNTETFRSMLRDHLTDRQWEVLRIAHDNGYFQRPREFQQQDIAAEMGISQETVSQHLRAAERQLLSTVFDDVLSDTTER